MEKDDEGEVLDVTLFKQIVESLCFLCNTRPNISYVLGLISRFMCEPKRAHMYAAKSLLRYLQGTLDYGIMFPYSSMYQQAALVGYLDSDYCG